MKKKLIVMAGAAMLLFQACQESNVVSNIEEEIKDNNYGIEFANYVGGITRASKKVGATFVNGDEMEVYGIQTTQDSTVAKLFNKQKVTSKGETIWSYAPLKYWEKNSTYDFYAIYPYSTGNSFSFETNLFKVTDFTVQNNANEQTDIMIAQKINNHQPYNVVNFVFNHILSNVNFYFKLDEGFDTLGLSQLVVTSFDVVGLYGKGSFTQTGWNNNNKFNGTWTADVKSVYDMPLVSNVVYTVGDAKATLADDLLLLPQTINENAQIKIAFKLIYKDETESIYEERIVNLKDITLKRGTESLEEAKWDPNFRYNYVISIDPSKNEHGGTHNGIANDKHDQDFYDDPNHDPVEPEINIIPVDTNDDGLHDEWWVDEDLDDEPDYPIIWKDIDGDGKEEALPDRDQDGEPDDSDGDGNPDVIWIDTNNDGEVDTELEREVPQPDDEKLPDDPEDPSYPDTVYVDYKGAEDGGYKTPTAWLVKDSIGEYYIDTDHDGQGDIHVVWKDIDGDGKLEGVPDVDEDGKVTPVDNYDGDGKDYNGYINDNDVILYTHINEDGTDYEKDDEGNIVWYELEKDPSTPQIPEIKNLIEFSASVDDWEDDYDAEHKISYDF
jgi:hypothetical protein